MLDQSDGLAGLPIRSVGIFYRTTPVQPRKAWYRGDLHYDFLAVSHTVARTA